MIALLEKMTEKNTYWAIVAALFIIFTGMRLFFINADAPQDLTISAAIFTDEGFKSYSPRNRALFGDWKWTPDDRYESWVSRSPLSTYSYTWIFDKLGVSFFSIRILSIIYGALAMALLFAFLVRNFGRFEGLLGLILMGTNFFTTMWNRIGIYEPHLLFFLMAALLGYSEAFRRWDKSGGPGSKIISILTRFFFFILATAGIVAGFYVKRSMLIVFPAIIPALIFIFFNRFEKLKKHSNKVFIFILGAIFITYFILGNFIIFKRFIVYILILTQVAGRSLSDFVPIVLFDPIHITIGKGLYMEFIFLHPFTFGAALLYSMHTFYNYIRGKVLHNLDLILSSWLLFGFIILSLTYYHPARYYLVITLPLLILATRAITRFADADLQEYPGEKKLFPHNIMVKIFIFFGILYSTIILFIHVLPFTLRDYLMQLVYPALLKKDYVSILPALIPAVIFIIATITLVSVKLKKIIEIFTRPAFRNTLLIIIVSLQLIQYGKWFIFHENRLYTMSQELGKKLPENAVLAGSWSAGLVVENKFRSLVIQSYVPYNHETLQKLILNEEISVTRKSGDGIKTMKEKNIPLYIAICRDVIFEKTIASFYKDYLIPENLISRARLGYFNVEVFKVDKSIPFKVYEEFNYYRWLEKNLTKMNVPTGQ